jgi:DNA-binding NtrC family response regulator
MIDTPPIALVIDDEIMVRRLVRRMLEPEVCRVVEAGDGEAGLRLIERHDGISVVLTDLLMPGIDGYDVVEVLTVHRPELALACMSGFASHTSVGRRLLVPFIPKPFDAESLRALLLPLLARSPGVRTGVPRSHSNEDDDGAPDLVAAAHALRRQRAVDRAPR